MFSAIVPELMTITVFVLSILCITAGQSPGHLQNYEVLHLNVTDLKAAYHAKTSEILPIHDFYNIHLSTYCAGYYHDGSNPPLVNVSCSRVSSYTKFLPSSLIASDLLHASSNATLHSLSFPPEIQSDFISTYNLQLHVSYIFYVMSLVWTGIALILGLFAFIGGQVGAFLWPFTSWASTCLLISSAILTAAQSQATATINLYGQGLLNGAGNGMGVTGGYGSGLLALSWSATGLSMLSSFTWGLGAIVSEAVRG